MDSHIFGELFLYQIGGNVSQKCGVSSQILHKNEAQIGAPNKNKGLGYARILEALQK